MFFVGSVTTQFGAAFGRPNKISVAFGDWATVHFRHWTDIMSGELTFYRQLMVRYQKYLKGFLLCMVS